MHAMYDPAADLLVVSAYACDVRYADLLIVSGHADVPVKASMLDGLHVRIWLRGSAQPVAAPPAVRPIPCEMRIQRRFQPGSPLAASRIVIDETDLRDDAGGLVSHRWTIDR